MKWLQPLITAMTRPDLDEVPTAEEALGLFKIIKSSLDRGARHGRLHYKGDHEGLATREWRDFSYRLRRWGWAVTPKHRLPPLVSGPISLPP